METKVRTPRGPETVMKTYTIRPDQADAIEILATQVTGHYNRSQIVRDALDVYIGKHGRAIESARQHIGLDRSDKTV